MDQILELATKLGKQIAQDPRAQAMATARKNLGDSTEDRQLLTEYEEQQTKLATLEGEGKPIEPEDKRQLADLHGRVISSEVIKALMKAQTAYVDLMNGVSRTIEQNATQSA